MNEFVNYFQLEIDKKDAMLAKQRDDLKEASKLLETSIVELREE